MSYLRCRHKWKTGIRFDTTDLDASISASLDEPTGLEYYKSGAKDDSGAWVFCVSSSFGSLEEKFQPNLCLGPQAYLV